MHRLMRKERETRFLWFSSVVVGLALAGLAAPAQGAPLACGTVLTANTTLTDDVGPCDTASAAWALKVVGPAVLNLNGHTVSCAPTEPDGIVLDGKGAQVKNGTVMKCSNGLLLMGAGSHIVQNVVAEGNLSDGFQVTGSSSSNQFLRNTAIANGSNGFFVFDAGASTLFTDNTASRNAESGFHVHATGQTFQRNVSTKNSEDGFRIDNCATCTASVAQNVATGNTGDGFHIHGAKHMYNLNVAVGNAGIGFRHDSGDGGHTFVNNTASDNSSHGFRINRDGDILSTNRAFANGLDGIHLDASAQKSSVHDNVALNNVGTDLVDDNLNCDSNLWKNDVFGSASPVTCIH